MTSSLHDRLGAEPDRWSNVVRIDSEGLLDLVEFIPDGAMYDPIWDEVERWYIEIAGPWNRLEFLDSDVEQTVAELNRLIDRYLTGEL